MAFAAAVVVGTLSLGSNISVIGSLNPGATIGVHAGREATLGGAQVMELDDVALTVVDVIDPELASAGAADDVKSSFQRCGLPGLRRLASEGCRDACQRGQR